MILVRDVFRVSRGETGNAHVAGVREALDRETLRLAARWLAERDAHLAVLLQRNGPPPLWTRRPGFATLLRIILEQQVSLASGRAIFARLAERVSPLAPERLLEVGEAGLRALGLTRQKAAYCHGVARAIVSGELDLGGISRMEDGDARSALMGVHGVGPWTADIYLLMALRRRDVWPMGDLALAASTARVKRLRGRLSPERLARIAEIWRPYRSVAARMLWQDYLSNGPRPDPRNR